MRFLLGLAIVLLTACAPSGASTSPPAAATQPPAALPSSTISAINVESSTEPPPGEVATAVPLATSRGPNLEATDPAAVSLASGGLQFVEFFRFT